MWSSTRPNDGCWILQRGFLDICDLWAWSKATNIWTEQFGDYWWSRSYVSNSLSTDIPCVRPTALRAAYISSSESLTPSSSNFSYILIHFQSNGATNMQTAWRKFRPSCHPSFSLLKARGIAWENVCITLIQEAHLHLPNQFLLQTKLTFQIVILVITRWNCMLCNAIFSPFSTIHFSRQ